jgi:hypothetical protein
MVRFTFKKNQSTKTCLFEPATRMRRIRRRMKKLRI